VLAHYIRPKKLAFVMINSDVSRDYDQRARAQWPQLMPGLEFLTMFGEGDRQDFQPETLKLRQFGPDAVYVLLVGAHTYAWADQFAASGLGRNMVIFGDSEYGDPLFLQKTHPKTDLHLANAVTFEAPITPLTLPFFQGYKAKYGAGPPYHSVQTYDGTLMMLEGRGHPAGR
jgi:ABC-type branched-subunit amino acid transport system substrate-binding protein